ncbi:hypothetical protein GCM10009681_14790 [Luedemannella helvata]|uniref:DUF7718 domain-containing protein n=2 Tax=Luedemannella helvata TaxID=349315 RepID=A0ABP4W1C1_9ACTN
MYKPPPEEECHCETFVFHPTGRENDPIKLHVRFMQYQGKIVDFSINQVFVLDGISHDIARIDTAHGTIHRHQFFPRRQQVRTVITEIPVDDGWNVVDKGYDNALDVMQDEWDDNLRRWNSDRA